MPNQNNSIVNLGDLAEPAKVLIEKISEAVGGLFKPYQIKRVAQAEAEAEKIKAISKIEITAIQERALNRFMLEEASKQGNIENITLKSLPALSASANPANIEKDWIVDFFDRARLTSDEEMQELWAQILAGEANAPGTYTKRTIHLLASLDKKDALLFAKLCNFVWNIEIPIPLVFDFSNEIYKKNGITFDSLKHLDSIGLISLEGLTTYTREGFDKTADVLYGGKKTVIEFPNTSKNVLNIGHVLFTDVGAQLSGICKTLSINGVFEYVLNEWAKLGIKEITGKA